MMRRRDFLAGAAATPLAAAAHGVKRQVFLPSPGKGTAVMAYAYYTKPAGGDMISVEQRLSRSDTIDISYYRKSLDNGRTWSQPKAVPTGEKRPNGMWRKHPRAAYVDPRTGRLLEFWLEGILPSDNPLEGMKQWNVYYRVGENGETRQVIAGAGSSRRAIHCRPYTRARTP